MNVRTVEDLLRFPLVHVNRMRGVGSRTRRELTELARRLAARFPEAAEGPRTTPAGDAVTVGDDGAPASVDELRRQLVPAGRSAEAKRDAGVLAALLRLADGGPAGEWPSQSDVARALGVTLERLGRTADRLAGADPLPSPARVIEALQAVAVPAGATPPTPKRLPVLAAAVSRGAALSSRLELYPRGMAADRVLKLALGALAGARTLTPDEICRRVAGRYPEAAPLPDRPALDTLLRDAGSELVWKTAARGGRGAYESPFRAFVTVSSETSYTRTTGERRGSPTRARQTGASPTTSRISSTASWTTVRFSPLPCRRAGSSKLSGRWRPRSPSIPAVWTSS